MAPKPTTKLGLNWLDRAENQREKPIRNFSIDPASSIRTSIADPVFADPVSETPIEGRNTPFREYDPFGVRPTQELQGLRSEGSRNILWGLELATPRLGTLETQRIF